MRGQWAMAGGPLEQWAMAGGPLELWNHWSIQILVLLSLALQVVLFFFAGIRRRNAYPVLRPLLWLAYQLADSTAIYALGHLSLSSAAREHQLVAFWAPFLLLHLGGPDSISAYALQDNQLWLRHLQNLVVQVLAAAYVLYKHVAGNGSLVLLAAILMFAVGLAKYGERTWALRCSNMDNIRSSLKEPRAKHHHFYPLDQGRIREEAPDKEEFHLRRAHSLFHICKRAIVDYWIVKDSKSHDAEMLRDLTNGGYKGVWASMEMELSLLYDILYTKAAVIHTWRGYCIRVVSPLATAASLLLFQFSGKDGHSRVDVAVTYALLAGAFLLETTSLLSALGSTWTYTFLCATPWSWLHHEALCTGRWDRLRRLVKTITRRQSGRARRWSGKIGQYNMLHLCVRRNTGITVQRGCPGARRLELVRTPLRAPAVRPPLGISPLLGRLAKMMGLTELWNTKHYSGTTEISDELKKWLFKYIERLSRKDRLNTQGVIRKNWGQEPLEGWDLYEYFKSCLGVELQEGIIIWHIGTDVFLVHSSGAKADDAAHLVKAIRTMSNYMMFLLVDRPYMLPGLAQTRLYQRTCENLVEVWQRPQKDANSSPNRPKDENSSPNRPKDEHSSPNRPNRNIFTMLKELFRLSDGPNLSGLTQRDKLARKLYEENPPYSPDVPRLSYAIKVAEKLLEKESEKEKEADSMAVLKLVRDVWLDFLVYTANRCSRESHAKKLSNGGELTTVLWLMADYLHQESLNALDEA